MHRLCTLLLAVFVLITADALAQGRRISTFPYTQNFGFVTPGITAFPTAAVDGGEFTFAPGTTQWTTDITAHGLNDNGGAGGAIRLQSTAGGGAAGIVWYSNFACNTADSLVLDWSKVANTPEGASTNELRIATNNGSGTTFTDIPLSSVAGGAWPSFMNSAAAQSGTLRVKLPASLNDAADARIRIYSVNTSSSGNHPRVVIDNLSITGSAIVAPAGSLDSITNAGNRTLTLFMTPNPGADSIVVIRSAGAAPTAVPTNGTRYTVGQGLNATDTVAYVGRAVSGPVQLMNLQPLTTYHFNVYGYRSCNVQYSMVPASRSSATLDCSGAPANVTNAMALSRTQDSIRIGYNVNGRTDSVLVIRRRNVAPTAVPTNGTRYTVGQGLNATDTVIYFGPVSPIMARNLQADSTYAFAIYGFQSCNTSYSGTRALVTARTYCRDTIGNVSDVNVRFTTATSAGLTIDQVANANNYIVFSNGPDTLRPRPVSGVQYSVGNIVGDDTVRYIGTNRQAILTGLNPSTTYRFTAFGVRDCNFAYSTLSDTVRATTLAACAGGLPGAVDSVRTIRNVNDTLTLRWRRTTNATNYLVIARVDSSNTMFPTNNTFYSRNESLGAGTIVLGSTSDTTITLTGLPQNVAYFIRVVAYRGCDLSYGPASPVAPVATRGTATAQRFALRAGSKDTIRFAGAVVAFNETLRSDGSLLITRRSGQMNLDGIPMFRQGEPVLDILSTDRWWSFDWVYIGDTTNATLKFDITGMPGVRDTNDLEIVFRTDEIFPWEDFITTGYEVDSTGRYLVSENRPFLSSDYAIGGYSGLNPLPVKLLSFDGVSREGRNILRWRTAEETDNAGFRLYRATAGGDESFALVADYVSDSRLRGAGNASQSRSYGYVDESSDLRQGNSYIYRLEEVSLDGSSNEIGRLVLTMDAQGRLAGGLRVVPNPVTGSTANISYALAEDGPLRVTLVNAVGETVRVITDDRNAQAGAYSLALNVADLPAGTYFCRVVAGGAVSGHPVTIVR